MKRGFAILLIVLFCCGFVPQHKAARQKAPLKPVSELYSEAIKSITIHKDTVKTVAAIEAIFQQDSNYAPALNLLSKITRNPQNAIKYSERAYLADTTNRYYLEDYGAALVEGGEFNKAIPLFEKIVVKSTDPNHYRALAILLDNNNRTIKALAVLDTAEIRFGRIPQLSKMRQYYLLKLGRILEAEADAKKCVEEAPYLVDNHITLGNIYASTRRDSLAVVTYQNAIAIDSLSIQPWLALAGFYNKKGDMASYLSMLPRIFANDQLPLEDKITEWKTLISNRENYRRFYYQYDSIIKQLYILNPDNRSVIYLYIDHLLSSGEKEEALRLFKQLAKGDNPTEKDFEYIIFIEEALNRPDSIAHYLNLASKRLPNNERFLAVQGVMAEEKKEYDKAVELYTKVLNVTKSSETRSNILVNIGRVESLRDNMKGCYKAFDKALKYSKDNDTVCSQLLASLGDIEHGRGDMKRCFSAYDKALKRFADNAGVLNNYAYFLSLEGRDLDRALTMITRALSLSEKNSTYLDTMAWVLYKLGRYAEAKKYMQQALSLYRGKDYTYSLHYGDILHALGEEFMAKTYWRKALEQGADKEEIERRFLPEKSQ